MSVAAVKWLQSGVGQTWVSSTKWYWLLLKSVVSVQLCKLKSSSLLAIPLCLFHYYFVLSVFLLSSVSADYSLPKYRHLHYTWVLFCYFLFLHLNSKRTLTNRDSVFSAYWTPISSHYWDQQSPKHLQALFAVICNRYLQLWSVHFLNWV